MLPKNLRSTGREPVQAVPAPYRYYCGLGATKSAAARSFKMTTVVKEHVKRVFFDQLDNILNLKQRPRLAGLCGVIQIKPSGA